MFYQVADVDAENCCVIFLHSSGEKFFPVFVPSKFGSELRTFQIGSQDEPTVVLHDFLLNSWEQLMSRVICVGLSHNKAFGMLSGSITMLSIDPSGDSRYVMMNAPIITALIISIQRDLPIHVSQDVLDGSTPIVIRCSIAI